MCKSVLDLNREFCQGSLLTIDVVLYLRVLLLFVVALFQWMGDRDQVEIPFHHLLWKGNTS